MKNNKTYKLEQSPLYKLASKSKLASLLHISKRDLILLSKNQPYKSFDIEVSGKIREVDNPQKKLKEVQTRIKSLLAKIETPNWLFSGKKGCSYIDNASFHQESQYVVTCDIKSFYSNCTKERVFQTFRYVFKISEDVSWVLANLLSYKNIIPTGSPSSQIIAFWAYYPTFRRISKLAESYNAVISLYVDDITISSTEPIPKAIALEVKKELEKVGHTVKTSKTKRYGKKDYKLITGVVISPDGELMVPNRRRKKLADSINQNSSLSSIQGQIRSAQMIDSSYESSLLEKVKKKNNEV